MTGLRQTRAGCFGQLPTYYLLRSIGRSMHQLSQVESKPVSGKLCLCGSILLLSVLLVPIDRALATVVQAEPDRSAETLNNELKFPVAAGGVSKAEVAAAQKFGEGLSNSKWVDYLGPLAPVALSPFFGIVCLSGMAMYGGQHVSPDNPFLGEGSALRNPALFWTFVFLTVLTSLPRLTKVSKPFAQAMDQVETWAGIITLLVLKVISSSGDPVVEPDAFVLQAGFFSASADTLLMVASVINIVVINMVKFFFEMLIWITPIPFLDAVFEVANKSVCAGLMGIYAWSPTLATLINLVMFSACLLVFGWVKRREVFFRKVMFDPLLSFFFKGSGEPQAAKLTVFPKGAFGPFKARAKCVIEPNSDGWLLTQKRLFRPALTLQIEKSACQASLEPGFLTNSILLAGEPNANLSFSQKHNGHLQPLAELLKVSLQEPRPEPSGGAKVGLA